ncbi:hypothetical protein OQA88_5608 [Cercophora sp. LCS_1]
MAPSAITPPSSPGPGPLLESISDEIDTLNILKDRARARAKLAAKQALYDAQPTFDAEKDKSAFRQYTTASSRVKNFYAEQHAKQTLSYNLLARSKFHSPSRVRPEMTVWEAIEMLNTLIDESDPDTELSQIQHLLQSAEAIRRDGKPRWMQLVGLIHDLGKLMLFFDGAQGQWDVVGDTFPVGCRFDEACVFPETFAANPDLGHEVYGSEMGIYEEGCGIDELIMSWGHDEYLYLVVRDQSLIPEEGLAMIRYHSFYPWHKEGAYGRFMKNGDEALLRAVRAFNPYDLYSKSDEVPKVEELKPYYLELIGEFFPQGKIKW